MTVDFDGTLCTDAFQEVGKPKTLVIEYVKLLAAEGAKIMNCFSNCKRLWAAISTRHSIAR